MDETDKDRCTYNEVIDADNPQTPEEVGQSFKSLHNQYMSIKLLNELIPLFGIIDSTNKSICLG